MLEWQPSRGRKNRRRMTDALIQGKLPSSSSEHQQLRRMFHGGSCFQMPCEWSIGVEATIRQAEKRHTLKT